MLTCDAVVLAAGSSSRLGSPKQLLQLDGETLLRRITRAALRCGCRKTIVVLGYQIRTIGREIEDLEVEIVENPEWSEGMGSSVRLAAKRALLDPASPAGLLFVTCDQPSVDAHCLSRLLETAAANPETVAAAAYDQTVGVPALFKRVHFEELAKLGGDKGARPLLEKYRASVLSISMPEAGLDIDTDADWQSLIKTR